jgi:acyl carrier protein
MMRGKLTSHAESTRAAPSAQWIDWIASPRRNQKLSAKDKPELQPCLASSGGDARRAGAMSLYQIVRKILGRSDVELDEDATADNTPGWHSLNNIELIFALESAYRVRFTVKEVARLRTIGDLRRLLIAKGADVDRVETDQKQRLGV